MSKYIDAEKFMASVTDGDFLFDYATENEIRYLVEKASASGVEPVTYCMNCKNCKIVKFLGKDTCECQLKDNYGNRHLHLLDYFCADGKTKDNSKDTDSEDCPTVKLSHMTVKEFYEYCKSQGWEDFRMIHEDYSGEGPDLLVEKDHVTAYLPEHEVYI